MTSRPQLDANSTLTGCESLEHDEITDPGDPIHPRRGRGETQQQEGERKTGRERERERHGDRERQGDRTEERKQGTEEEQGRRKAKEGREREKKGTPGTRKDPRPQARRRRPRTAAAKATKLRRPTYEGNHTAPDRENREEQEVTKS